MKRGSGIKGRDDKSSGMEIFFLSLDVVYFQQYKKRAKAKGNKKCHTETMRGKIFCFSFFFFIEQSAHNKAQEEPEDTRAS
jgi:hypothetical protein